MICRALPVSTEKQMERRFQLKRVYELGLRELKGWQGVVSFKLPPERFFTAVSM